jgi:uncharacterized membrane protein YeaQ/YmgE (transglycosylase-associated protein family)
MFGAIIVGLLAGIVGRMLMPGDPFRHMSGPRSWGISLVIGLAGALLGYLIFTVGFGIGDTDVFDFGGIVGAVIGVILILFVVGWYMRNQRPRDPTQRPVA